MNEHVFLESLKTNSLPDFEGNQLLIALWFVMRGDWNSAHKIVQDDESKISCWIHALIHKIEGDVGNSRYWYAKARVKFRGDLSVEDEGREILKLLLS